MIKTHLSLLAERIRASVASPSADVWPQLFCRNGLHVRGNQLAIQFCCDLQCVRLVIFHVTPYCTRYFNVLVIFYEKTPTGSFAKDTPCPPQAPPSLAARFASPGAAVAQPWGAERGQRAQIGKSSPDFLASLLATLTLASDDVGFEGISCDEDDGDADLLTVEGIFVRV